MLAWWAVCFACFIFFILDKESQSTGLKWIFNKFSELVDVLDVWESLINWSFILRSLKGVAMATTKSGAKFVHLADFPIALLTVL